MIKQKGDIVDFYIKDKIDILFHQCNCFASMGSGVALQIAAMFPEALEMDRLTKKGDPKKMGQFSFAFTDERAEKVICNLYGQYRFGPRGKQYTEYDALLKALENARDWLLKAGLGGKRIGIPYKMGCDRGGGKWEIVENMINYVFSDTNFEIILVEWEKK